MSTFEVNPIDIKIEVWRAAVTDLRNAELALLDKVQRLGNAVAPMDARDGEIFHFRQNSGVLTVRVTINRSSFGDSNSYAISWADRQ